MDSTKAQRTIIGLMVVVVLVGTAKRLFSGELPRPRILIAFVAVTVMLLFLSGPAPKLARGLAVIAAITAVVGPIGEDNSGFWGKVSGLWSGESGGSGGASFNRAVVSGRNVGVGGVIGGGSYGRTFAPPGPGTADYWGIVGQNYTGSPAPGTANYWEQARRASGN